MKLRKITTLATAGTAIAGLSLLGFGVNPANAENGVQPVTFEVSSGSLALAQTPDDGTVLVQGTAVDMPVTTVTDGRNAFDRTGAWSVTATASNLTVTAVVATVPTVVATILAGEITLAQSGEFTSGSGTVGALGLVSASARRAGSWDRQTRYARCVPALQREASASLPC